MTNTSIYKDIATRTDGSIFLSAQFSTRSQFERTDSSIFISLICVISVVFSITRLYNSDFNG